MIPPESLIFDPMDKNSRRVETVTGDVESAIGAMTGSGELSMNRGVW
jgi:hypothetical protein